MIFIAHRGNLHGPNPSCENSPAYIDEAIRVGAYVEVDVRHIGGLWHLGHDYPQHEVSEQWIDERSGSLLLHMKDFEAAKAAKRGWHYFCHSADAFTITSRGYTWLHDLSLVPGKSTILPLMTKRMVEAYPRYDVHGICSDFMVDWAEWSKCKCGSPCRDGQRTCSKCHAKSMRKYRTSRQ